jgi:hypothetical protein
MNLFFLHPSDPSSSQTLNVQYRDLAYSFFEEFVMQEDSAWRCLTHFFNHTVNSVNLHLIMMLSSCHPLMSVSLSCSENWTRRRKSWRPVLWRDVQSADIIRCFLEADRSNSFTAQRDFQRMPCKIVRRGHSKQCFLEIYDYRADNCSILPCSCPTCVQKTRTNWKGLKCDIALVSEQTPERFSCN